MNNYDINNNPNKWPLHWILYWYYKNFEYKVLNKLYINQDKLIKFIINLSCWNYTPWYKQIDKKRDWYTVIDYTNQLTTDNKFKKIINTIFENQLKWIEQNPHPIISKKDILIICFNTLKQIVSLSNLVGIQPLTEDNMNTFIMKYKQSHDNILSLEVIKNPVDELITLNSYNCVPNKDKAIGLYPTIGFLFGEQIAKTILQNVLNLAKQSKITEVELTPIDDNSISFFVERVKALTIHINVLANDIARTTRRGAGNIVITNQTGGSLLQMLPNFVAPFTNTPSICNGHIKLIGNLSGLINVYVTHFDFDTTKIPFLVGYKGRSNQIDTGFVYSPNTLCQISEWPHTENESFHLSSSEYQYSFEATDEFPNNSTDYYRLLLVDSNI